MDFCLHILPVMLNHLSIASERSDQISVYTGLYLCYKTQISSGTELIFYFKEVVVLKNNLAYFNSLLMNVIYNHTEE